MKSKKSVCLILSALLTVPCFCLASCDSESGDAGDISGDVGGLSTDGTQKPEENKTPLYTAPEKYKELAKSDKVYRSGIYTGYSIIMGKDFRNEYGEAVGYNLSEIMLDSPGEALPVHEDPMCSHDSNRCPTESALAMPKRVLIIEEDGGLPVIFYFCIDFETIYSEEGEAVRQDRVAELRGYDVETGEYVTVSKLDLGSADNAVLYKGKIYFTGDFGYTFGMVDILTGTSKIIEGEDFYNEYNVLGIENDRLYYMYVFGEEETDEHRTVKNECTLKSCSLDLDDVRTEYDFGDLGTEYSRGGDIMYFYSYMDGSTLYFPRAFRYSVDPEDYTPDIFKIYTDLDLQVFDIYTLDLNDISAGEKLMFENVYKFAVKNGKIYYTLVDYEEVGEISSFELPQHIKMFGSTDGGTLYEYDIATGATREVCRDSGYNIYEIYEITDDGKMFFNGTDYVNFVPADEGFYTAMYSVGRKEYCMLDLSTGEVTELYSTLEIREEYSEDVIFG